MIKCTLFHEEELKPNGGYLVEERANSHYKCLLQYLIRLDCKRNCDYLMRVGSQPSDLRMLPVPSRFLLVQIDGSKDGRLVIDVTSNLHSDGKSNQT